MKHKLILLSGLLVAQLVLAAGLAWRADPLAPARQARALAPGLDTADRLEISDGEGHTAVVQKGAKGWRLANHFDAPASPHKVQQALDALAAVRLDQPVATTEAAARRFEVAKDKFARHLVVKKGDEILLDLYLGRSAGVGRAHVRLAGEAAIHQARLGEWDFPAKPGRWLDQTLLQAEARKPKKVRLGTLVLHKEGEGEKARWRADGLAAGESLDQDGLKKLLDALAGVQVDDVLGIRPDPAWGLDHPERSIEIEGEKGHVTWTIGHPEGADHRVLKSSAHPWYFRLEGWNAKPLLDATERSALVKGAAAAEKKSDVSEKAPPGGTATTVSSKEKTSHTADGDSQSQ